MTDSDPAKIKWSFREDLMPYFGARKYEARNGLQNYHKSQIGDPSMNESAAIKLLGLHIYSVGVISLASSAIVISGLAAMVNNAG